MSASKFFVFVPMDLSIGYSEPELKGFDSLADAQAFAIMMDEIHLIGLQVFSAEEVQDFYTVAQKECAAV